MGRSFTKAIKSAEMQGVLKQIPPDAAQAMGQTNTLLGNIVKASGVATPVISQLTDTQTQTTPIIQPVAPLQFDNEERAKRVEGSLGRAAFGPERIREILMQLKGLNFLADGGRVGYQAGGPATPEQYAAALQQVSAGPASQQVQSLGEYLKNYSTSVGQSIDKGIASLYGGPKLAEIATAYNRERNLPTATGEISNLRHSTAFSQFRDKLAQAAGMASPFMFGINQAMGSTAPNTLQQAIGTIGASIAGIGTEIPQLATKPSEAIEDIKANLTGITQIPTGLSVPEGYEAAQKIYSPSQQLTDYEQYVMNTQGVPVSEAQFNAGNQLAPDGDIAAAGFTSDLEYQKARDALADQLTVGGQTSPLSKQSIYENILKNIGTTYNDPNFGNTSYSNPLGIFGDLKETPQENIKQSLDNLFLQGSNFSKPAEYGVYGTGAPFRRYTPESLASRNYSSTSSPLKLFDIYSGYGLNEQLNQLQDVYGKSFVNPYRNQLQDSFIDYYKTGFTGNPGFVQNIFGLSNAPTFRYGGSVDDIMGITSLFTRKI